MFLQSMSGGNRLFKFSSPNLTLTINLKTEPFPNSDSIQILPSIISTMRFDMDSPSPVPPNLREVLCSACSNKLKSRGICSWLIPMPVSLTSTWMRQFSPSNSNKRASMLIEPSFGVNFTALERRFVMTCARRCSSAISIRGMSLFM